jgi:adhesin transport system outer membrane protein
MVAALALPFVVAGCAGPRSADRSGTCNRTGVLAMTCPQGTTAVAAVGVAANATPSRTTLASDLPPPAATPASPPPVDPAPVLRPPGLMPPPSSAVTGSTSTISPAAPRVLISGTGQTQTLSEMVAASLSDHPEIGIARARARESVAAIRTARSGLYPQIDGRFSIGQGTPIVPEEDFGTVESGASMTNQRTGTLTLRQLVFDFGATRNDILRSRALADAERYRLLDRMDEVALRTVNAYLKVLEQRELITLAQENVAAHRRISELVRANQREGNSTVADVSRVAARLVEAETTRTNLETEAASALDQLRRLTKIDPGRLVRPPVFAERLPPNPDAAIERMRADSPRLKALQLASGAIRNEISSTRAGGLPRIGFEFESTVKDYAAPVSRTETDVRGMLVLRQRIFDGGARRSQVDQANSRLNESEYRFRNESEDLENNIRQAYRAITASRSKLANLRQGVASSRQVRELYTEQFTAGRRTLFEVLDAQQALYTAQRDQIVNQFEELRASHSLLRSLGRLSESILAVR